MAAFTWTWGASCWMITQFNWSEKDIKQKYADIKKTQFPFQPFHLIHSLLLSDKTQATCSWQQVIIFHFNFDVSLIKTNSVLETPAWVFCRGQNNRTVLWPGAKWAWSKIFPKFARTPVLSPQFPAKENWSQLGFDKMCLHQSFDHHVQQ